MIFDQNFWNSLNYQWNWLRYNIALLRYALFHETLRWSWDNISKDRFTLKLEIMERIKSLNMTFLMKISNTSNSTLAEFEYSVLCFFVLDRKSFTSPLTLINFNFIFIIVLFFLKNISRLLSGTCGVRKKKYKFPVHSTYISDLFFTCPRYFFQNRFRQISVDIHNHSLQLHDVTIWYISFFTDISTQSTVDFFSLQYRGFQLVPEFYVFNYDQDYISHIFSFVLNRSYLFLSSAWTYDFAWRHSINFMTLLHTLTTSRNPRTLWRRRRRSPSHFENRVALDVHPISIQRIRIIRVPLLHFALKSFPVSLLIQFFILKFLNYLAAENHLNTNLKSKLLRFWRSSDSEIWKTTLDSSVYWLPAHPSIS